METQILDGFWQLEAEDQSYARHFNPYFKENTTLEIAIPGDIHSAFTAAGIQEDIHKGKTFKESTWISNTRWCISRDFDYTPKAGRTTLVLSRVDTVAAVYLNGTRIRECSNFFRRYLTDVTDYLREGSNTISIYFTGAHLAADELARRLPLTYPSFTGGHENLLRRPQYQAGMLGPGIETIGIHDSVRLVSDEVCFVKSWNCIPRLVDHNWICKAEVTANVFTETEAELRVGLVGRSEHTTVHLEKGNEYYSFTFTIPEEDVEKWSPAGYGGQHLYPMDISIASFQDKRMIAFRSVEIKNEPTAAGRELVISVNGRDVFAKGINWTPVDICPSRTTSSEYIKLLSAAAECGMNTVRVWGGGFYEDEVFYDTCDRLGIMVWQDLMFAGSVYRADDEFLDNVKRELKYQVRRLKSHPSLILWCGGGCTFENLTAFPETAHDMPRFLMDFTKLNQMVIRETLYNLDPSRVFWPSSPSAGPEDFSGNALKEEYGDMHFWKTSEKGSSLFSFKNTKPRFVSEAGYPSYPSLSVLRLYADESQLNISSPEFEERQMMKNANTVILENLAEAFRFPTSFENLLYMSQAQQAIWAQQAVHYWRSTRPECMGILLWNLGSLWPCSDTAAVEYGGKRKALMYASKSFFAPIIPIGIVEGGKLKVYVTNDTDKETEVKVSVKFASFHGDKQKQMVYRKVLPQDSVTLISTTDISQMNPRKTFCYLKVSTPELYRESTLFLASPKQADLEEPELKVNVAKSGHNFTVEVSCTRPAFSVLLDADDIPGSFTENFFSIRPTAQIVTTFINEAGVSLEEFKSKLRIYDLYSAGYRH